MAIYQFEKCGTTGKSINRRDMVSGVKTDGRMFSKPAFPAYNETNTELRNTIIRTFTLKYVFRPAKVWRPDNYQCGSEWIERRITERLVSLYENLLEKLVHFWSM